MAKASGKVNFPKVLYVCRSSGGTYYVAYVCVDELPNDTDFVAAYEVRDVKRLVVTRELK